jgi:hypothetical protein
MLATLMLTVLAGTHSPSQPLLDRSPGFARPRVEVWTNRGDDPYHAGQSARVYVRADRDAYVTIFRVDTDGRVRVLFPREPWEDGFVRGGHEFEVLGRHEDAFDIDDYPGVGYVFAVVAADPFDYDPIMTGDHWDYRTIADGRVRGDPYVALTDLAQRIVAANSGDWDYDITPYYVERRYDYPRFLCYDCHSYASYRYWNPYSFSCVRFRIVVFDDPYYYPYRHYGGTRVVFTRPFRPQPRFVFKDRGGVGDDRFVTRERERPLNDNGRRGVRGVDLGGRGSIPAPGIGERRRQSEAPAARRREEPSSARQRQDRPDQPDIREDNRRRVAPAEAEQRPSRPRTEPLPRHPDVDLRPSQPEPERRREWRPPADQPSRPSSPRPSEGERGQRAAPRPEARPEAPREGPRREAPRAEPRRGREAPAPKPGASTKPELRRRRP